MKHNIVVDYIRGVAIILIVTCHFLIFGGVRGWEPLGQWLAGIGNFLFFALSALLFGLHSRIMKKEVLISCHWLSLKNDF